MHLTVSLLTSKSSNAMHPNSLNAKTCYFLTKKDLMFRWPVGMLALGLLAGFFAALESTPAPAFRLRPPLLSDRLAAAAGGCAPCCGFSSVAGSAPCSAQGVSLVHYLDNHCGSRLPGNSVYCKDLQLHCS